MTGMSGMSNMTGNPDQDFLRMQSDHHKGLILMAHETVERKDNVTVKDEARTLDKEQDAGLDQMATMLTKDFKDSYESKVMPENKAMNDTLQQQKGATYDSTFRAMVIKHHQKGIQMIDEYLPKMTRPDVKQMAQKMKAEQQRDIQELQRKMSGRRS